MHIAFFDSGVGGLTVLDEALRQMPNESYIYFADTDNVPYGTRDNQEISQLVNSAIDFIANQDLKALVVACNTATSVVIEELRNKYKFPIVGMEPAIKPAVELSSKKILLCATTRTLQEEKLHKLIDDLDATSRIHLLSLQELVTYAEHYDFHSDNLKQCLRDKFGIINWKDYDSIVLGCTHFIFFRNILKELIPNNIHIIDGNRGTVSRLVSVISETKSLNPKPIVFYNSKRKVPPIYFDHYLRLASEQSYKI